MIENNNCEFNSNYPKRIFEVILEKSHNKEESNYFFNTDPNFAINHLRHFVPKKYMMVIRLIIIISLLVYFMINYI